ncbi:methionyl-tRNA formyltransferase [Streptomonospora nanhaiensis]|uniref:Methionyl-tRNA formyltransferase n=1 Tax=Streptomonospora nanhaiensis TaxID=1323731 RepID=A0A853BK13_9ACTN|nr:methionyl-tRNA formyltransferase [Streptomonospora nanhaiensis]MBV2362459.1 methionyl-tRNA formyltransferase [Streptomonospora nanhaiensis]MBX9389080.1 methionyl-tRNA formyltransferase [Streptomonospora nanhaiensis]NYI94882.1 methionyl-tRNA formyltransferase [Streptomonospora nanhaiensis]
MKLVFAGTPEAAVPSLKTLLASRHEVAAVVTRPDARAGRGRKVVPSPVAQVAAEAGVEVLKPHKAADPEFLARLRAIAPDCCPVVAYGALLRQEALDIPAHGWVNLHFSLLPQWRGAAPVQHALLHGDDLTGAATFLIEPDLDSGPVFGTVVEPIGPHDTSGDLLARLAETGAGLLLRTLDGIEAGTLRPQPQSADGVSFAPKLTSADAEVDFTAPAMRVDRLIRACTPAPGAWTTFRGERLKLGPVRPRTDADALPPGALAVTRAGVFAGTATHPVELGEVQPQGKRAMPAADWARGVRPAEADVLGA